MNNILAKLAAAIGGIAFLAALAIGCGCGVAIPVSLCRATIVMIVTTITVIFFFRFLAKVLREFVSQRIVEHNKALRAKDAERMQRP